MSKLAQYFQDKKLTKKKIVIASAGVLIIGLGIFSHGNNSSQLAAMNTKAGGPPGAGAYPPTHVEAVMASSQKISETQTAIGNVSSYESVEIRPEIDGKITSIEFQDGSNVKAGQVLFKLDSSVQSAAVAQAKASLSKAYNNSNRYNELKKKGFASSMKIDEAQAEVNLARANVQFAEANLAKTIIKAPLDGTVGIRRVSIGDYVKTGDLLVNLDQRDKMKIEFSLPEVYIKDIKIGDAVQIQSEPQIEGKISAIESRISENSRSIMVQVVADNIEGVLNSGQFVDVIVPISREKESVMVPDEALIPMGNKVFVYKVENNTAKKAEVKIGLRTDSESEIISGVKAGEVIVTAGQQKLMMSPVDGSPVRVSEPTKVESSPMAEEKEIGIKN